VGLYLLKYPYRRVLLPLAKRLKFIHPDVLSYAATLVTAGTAACYIYATARPSLLLVAIGLTLLRMTLNTMDGVIAIERGNLSLKGEIVNALPDRYSDILLVGGITLSPLCTPVLGVLGLASMLLVSYAGMLGKALGVEWQHHGPLGKVERLILVMGFSLWQYLLVRGGGIEAIILGVPVMPMDVCMVAFVALGQATVYNRVRGMVRQIARLEWRSRNRNADIAGKALVVYDSQTGNTHKVADAIAEALGADIAKVDDADDPSSYDLVVIGTPNIRARPTKKVTAFIEQCRGAIQSCAAFATYGAPVWGRLSTPGCLGAIRKGLGKRPWKTFSCKGVHAKFKTFKGHPTADELLSAFLFGLGLAKRLKRESERE